MVEQLEKDFARWIGACGSVATGFGRAALFLALRALRVESRCVAVPDFVCAQVPEAVRRAGGEPIFYPVGRDLSVCPEAFQSALEQDCSAAVVVHYFGQVLPQTEMLADICRQRNVPLIEDCALAWGASVAARHAGTFGDVAAFSFTKSDWCYGGGIVAARSAEFVARAREARRETFHAAAALALQYGVLRRLDFAANRPAKSRTAAVAGRWIESLSAFSTGNFYDAGRFDTQMPEFAAQRARRILETLAATQARRRSILASLRSLLRDAKRILVRPQLDSGDTAAFLLIRSAAGCATHWVEEADRHGVTLRLCWPAYQDTPAPRSDEVEWLASHLLILEIHPKLNTQEMARIAATLEKLAQQE